MNIQAALHDHERGRQATAPRQLTWKAWKEIVWRLWAEFNDDRVLLVAAGATFYLLLALFPALTAFVSLYGFVSDPSTIADHVAFLAGVLPAGGVEMIQGQLQSLASADPASLSWGFILGLVIALWSANSGIKTLFEAMNIAYDETEKRSFIWLNLFSLGCTLGAIIIGVLAITMVGVVPAVLAFVGLGPAAETIISFLRWPVLLVISMTAIAALYRYGPSRTKAKWRWITWGSAIATLVWIATSILFSWYLTNFADYNATYGSLGAVIGFMTWTWLSVTIVIAGAELNSEMEHQIARDSTVGPEKPLGSRGASMADKVANVTDRSATPEQKGPSAEANARKENAGAGGKSEAQQSEPGSLRAAGPRPANDATDEPSALGTAAAYALGATAVVNKVLGKD